MTISSNTSEPDNTNDNNDTPLQIHRATVCVTTSKPTVSLTPGGGGGAVTMLCPYTGGLQSSLRMAGDLAGKVPLGVSHLQLLPAHIGNNDDNYNNGNNHSINEPLAMAVGSTNRSDDSYGMLLTLRSTAPSILHWKCRLPEANLTAGWLVSPCGHYVVGGGASGKVYVWNLVEDGRLVHAFAAHYRAVAVLAWSDSSGPTSNYQNQNQNSSNPQPHLLTGGQDGMVHVFSWLDWMGSPDDGKTSSTTTPLQTWTQHQLPVTAVQSLGGGGRIISCGQDGLVVLAEICSGRVLAKLQLPHPLTSLLATSSHNSTVCWVGSQEGSLYQLDLDQYAIHQTRFHTGARVVVTDHNNNSLRQAVALSSSSEPYWQTLTGHDHAVTALALVPPANNHTPQTTTHQTGILVSGDQSGQVRCWDLASYTCVRVVHPWSHSNDAKTTAQHPVTSLRVVCSTTNNHHARLWTTNMNANANTNKKKRPAVQSLIPPLQKYPAPLPPGMVRLWQSDRRRRTSSTVMTDALVQQALQRQRAAVVFQTSKHHHDESHAPNNNKDDQIAQLQQELEQARSTIQRWETVNNKLMARLQK